MLQDYKPSNKVPALGLVCLILATLIGGAAIGALAYFASRLVYLIILFPLLMGLSGGGILYGAVKLGKVRNPAVAVVFGVLITLVIYGAYLFGSYLNLQGEVGSGQLVDSYLKSATGSSGFWGYLQFAAQQGVKIGRFGSTVGITFAGLWFWVYVLAEMTVIGFLSCATAYIAAKTPFCESSQKWMDDEKVIGGVPFQGVSQFKWLMTSGQIEEARALMIPQPQHHGELIVKAATCPDCAACDVAIEVKQIQFDKKNKATTKDYFEGMLPRAAYQQLTSPFASPPQPAPPYNAPAQNY